MLPLFSFYFSLLPNEGILKKLLSAIINFRIPISAILFCIATILLKIMHWTNSEFFHLLCAASGFYHYIENYLKLFFVWSQWFSPMLEITSLLLPYTRFLKGIQMTWNYNLSHDFYNFQIISIFLFISLYFLKTEFRTLGRI